MFFVGVGLGLGLGSRVGGAEGGDSGKRWPDQAGSRSMDKQCRSEGGCCVCTEVSIST